MGAIKKIFAERGGIFCVSEKRLLAKFEFIKAFVFDWDGVFNNGIKQYQYGSSFSDVDAMGTNLLRFSHYLQKERIPPTAIISGEASEFSVLLAQREHFNAIYLRAKNKMQAFHHFLKTYALNVAEVAFVFDDVLDIPLAKVCGLRLFVNRNGSPLFRKYIMDNTLADYITAQDGEGHAIREVCELLMGLSQQYQPVVDHRIRFSEKYRAYLSNRERIKTHQYTLDGDALKIRQKK